MLLRSPDSSVEQPELAAQSSSDQEDSCGSGDMRGMKLAQTLACTKPGAKPQPEKPATTLENILSNSQAGLPSTTGGESVRAKGTWCCTAA